MKIIEKVEQGEKMELETQRNDEERETRGRRSNLRTKEIHDAGNGKGIFFI